MAIEDLRIKISDVAPISDAATSFTLERPQELDYRPGQHLFVELEPENGKPFSLVSDPSQPFLEIATILREESAFKQQLKQKQPGDELIVSGPYGKFSHEEGRPSLFLAGGIGITPFISFLRDAQKRGFDAQITLLYSAKTQRRIAYRSELDDLQQANPNLEVIYTLTQESWQGPQGRITLELVNRHVPDIQDRTCYVVGPPAFVTAMRKLLKNECQVSNIKVEAFSGY